MLNKKKIKNILKSNYYIYRFYYIFGSLIMRFWGKFLKVNQKRILFVVYGGQRYDDSPRFVYEYFLKHRSDLDMYWAFIDPENISAPIPNEKKIKIDTLLYFRIAMSSKIWITNSSATRGLNILKKETKNFFFTHGMTGIKKVGKDVIDQTTQYSRGTYEERRDKIFLEGGQAEVDILTNAWNEKREVFESTGLPRNDELKGLSKEKILEIKKKMGINTDKKIVLYASTFRDYIKDSNNSVILAPPITLSKWKETLGDEYVLIYTAHYEVAKLLNIPEEDDFIINAFKYPQINDLISVADILVSDYSSIIFDFAILEKPIFSFAYDYKEYSQKRGLYEGYEKLFPYGISENEDDLIEKIKEMDFDFASDYVKKNIKYKYFSHFDSSTERCANIILNEMES